MLRLANQHQQEVMLVELSAIDEKLSTILGQIKEGLLLYTTTNKQGSAVEILSS